MARRRLSSRVASCALAVVAVSTLGIAWQAAVADDLLPVPPIHPGLQVAKASPSELLAAARSARAAGQLRTAQRVLRALIVRHPTAPEAIHARPLLEAITAQLVTRSQRYGLGVAPDADPLSTNPPGTGLSGWTPRVLGRNKRRLPQDDLAYAAGDRVFFSSTSIELDVAALKVLRAQARWLKTNRTFGFEIIGHADEPGSVADNLVISLRRAEAVKAKLVELGVPASRLKIGAMGRRHRIAVCNFTACFAQNRRVVTNVVGWSQSNGFRQATARR